MKRILLILIALAAAFAAHADNRNAETSFWRMFPYDYEVRLGWGGYPAYDEFYMIGSEAFNDKIYYSSDNPSLDSMYGDANGPSYMTGVFTGEFSVNLRRWFSFSTMLTVNTLWCDRYSKKDGMKTDTRRAVCISLVPEAKIYWVNRENTRYYSSLGLGYYVGANSNKVEHMPAFQICPFGVCYGKQFMVFAEYSFGTIFNGAQVGIGYRFN